MIFWCTFEGCSLSTRPPPPSQNQKEKDSRYNISILRIGKPLNDLFQGEHSDSRGIRMRSLTSRVLWPRTKSEDAFGSAFFEGPHLFAALKGNQPKNHHFGGSLDKPEIRYLHGVGPSPWLSSLDRLASRGAFFQIIYAKNTRLLSAPLLEV